MLLLFHQEFLSCSLQGFCVIKLKKRVESLFPELMMHFSMEQKEMEIDTKQILLTFINDILS